MTKVVFHLGDKKTGSTAIQTTLASKSWSCATVSLLYPGKERISHIAMAKSLMKRGGSPGLAAARFEDVANEIRAVKPDVAVISAEDFEDVSPVVLKDAVQQHMSEFAADARYIAYVRPHVERVASSYAERVKASGYGGSMDDLYDKFTEKGMLAYSPRFLKWRDAFGDAFVLRPMIRDRLYKSDVVLDFLQFSLGTDDLTVEKSPNANESVSLENLAVLHEMQIALKPDDGHRSDLAPAFCRYVARQMNRSANIQGTKVQFHRSLAEKMVVECAKDAMALDAAFFTGTPMLDALNAAPAKAVDQPQSVRLEDHFSAREQFLIRLWVEQTRSFVKADPLGWARMLRDEQREWATGTFGFDPGAAEDDETPATAPSPRAGGRRAGLLIVDHVWRLARSVVARIRGVNGGQQIGKGRGAKGGQRKGPGRGARPGAGGRGKGHKVPPTDR